MYSSSNYQKPYPNQRTPSPRPFAIKSQQQSSYFSNKHEGNTNNSGFSDSITTSLPNTPKMFHVFAPSPDNKNSGYDSDSSEEGRKPATPQTLGLRVLNPDDQDEIESVAVMETAKIEEKKKPVHVLPLNIPPLLPSESEWKVYKNDNLKKPDLPLHNEQLVTQQENMVICRESKTLDDEVAYVAAVDNLTTNQMKEIHTPTNELNNSLPRSSPVSLSNDPTTISELASPTSPSYAPTTPNINKPPTNFANPITSKYAKVSYHLTNDPTALKKYREMAEKTNDTTTQLMFAKYLLETANAFNCDSSTTAGATVVGSMWGIGSTTNKKQKPEPYLVVPPSNAIDHSTSSAASTSSIGAKTKSIGGVSTSKSFLSATINYHQQQQSLMNVTSKQQTSLNSHKRKPSNTANESNLQKRKLLEQEGIKWIIKLAKQNVPEACYMQANWMDHQMYDFKPNKNKSFALHSIAAKSSIPESVFAIAKFYEEENNRDISASRIVKLYKSAADAGYVNAIYKLAFLTIHGRLEVRQSLTEGLSLMYKACTLSSEVFNVPPYIFALILTNEYEQVDFPLSLLEPYGGKEAAILYYERAARLGNDESQSKLGSIYEHGLYGESMNFARAFDCYEQGALNGNDKAMLGLCRLNNRGSHGPGDKNESTRLENDVSGWLAATPINEDLAFSWCEKSAKAGNVDALSLLGWFYESGFGVPRDFSMAKKYYELAVEKGDLGAKTRLVNTNVSITKKQHESINGIENSNATKSRSTARNTSHHHERKKYSDCKCM